MTHNQKKNQTTERDPEIIEILELVVKDIKIIITMILCSRGRGKYKHEEDKYVSSFKKTNETSTDEKYNMWGKKGGRCLRGLVG